MGRKKEILLRWFHRFSISFLPAFISFSVSSNAAESEHMQTSHFQMRKVSLEAAVVYRSLQHLSWQEKHLPNDEQKGLILVVGHDDCLFKERLAYLLNEEKFEINKRLIEIISCESLKEAGLLIEKNPNIIFMIALSSVSDQWKGKAFPQRQGLVIYGQGDTYKRRGMGMHSFIQNNRLRVSVNFKRLNRFKVRVDQDLLSRNQLLFTAG